MWILPPILPSKIFVGFKNAKTNELPGAEPWTPSTRVVESPTLNLLLKWYKLKIHYKITYEFHPRFRPHKCFFLALLNRQNP